MPVVSHSVIQMRVTLHKDAAETSVRPWPPNFSVGSDSESLLCERRSPLITLLSPCPTSGAIPPNEIEILGNTSNAAA